MEPWERRTHDSGTSLARRGAKTSYNYQPHLPRSAFRSNTSSSHSTASFPSSSTDSFASSNNTSVTSMFSSSKGRPGLLRQASSLSNSTNSTASSFYTSSLSASSTPSLPTSSRPQAQTLRFAANPDEDTPFLTGEMRDRVRFADDSTNQKRTAMDGLVAQQLMNKDIRYLQQRQKQEEQDKILARQIVSQEWRERNPQPRQSAPHSLQEMRVPIGRLGEQYDGSDTRSWNYKTGQWEQRLKKEKKWAWKIPKKDKEGPETFNEETGRWETQQKGGFEGRRQRNGNSSMAASIGASSADYKRAKENIDAMNAQIYRDKIRNGMNADGTWPDTEPIRKTGGGIGMSRNGWADPTRTNSKGGDGCSLM